MPSGDVAKIEIAVSGLDPNQMYRVLLSTSDDDVTVVSLMQWDGSKHKWIRVQFETGER